MKKKSKKTVGECVCGQCDELCSILGACCRDCRHVSQNEDDLCPELFADEEKIDVHLHNKKRKNEE